MISPLKSNSFLAKHYPLEKDDTGTFFYISPVDEIINDDIDGNKDPKDATKIEKMLIGFHNTMTPNHPIPVLDISFRDYKGSDDTYINIIDKEHFFTKEDFELADHHFKGKFDAFGQFKGLIKIYHEKSVAKSAQINTLGASSLLMQWDVKRQ